LIPFIVLLQRTNYKQFIKYFFVGGICALIEWLAFWLTFYIGKLNYSLCVIIAFILATGVNYILAVAFVFSATGKGNKRTLFETYMVSAVGLLLNLLLMYLLFQLARLSAIFAKILATGIVFFWNYLSRSFFVFSPKRP
jgi:putative flippase GtrA